MPKNIIVLSDGTGNSAAKFNKTNVWRTYEALDLSDPKKQIAYYDDGVGTSALRPIALVTGAIGIGLSHNVREMYAYLCRNYEAGDRIYGFGFSRGAFTIRILAGFVARVGLLKRDAFLGEQDLWKKTTWLYRVYRKHFCGNGLTPPLAWAIRGLRDLWPIQAMDAENYRDSLDEDVEIEFMGLWDTVDAYGLPIEEMRVGWDRFIWPLSMRNRDLSGRVKKAVHALSLDDERDSFHPLLWNETGDSDFTSTVAPVRQGSNARHIKEERLSQVWFSGMHSDVGGGYADDFLSYVPLNFVLNQLGPEIRFNLAKRDEYRKAERAVGIMHDSRQGLGSYYRLQPRRLEKLLNTGRSSFRLSHGFVLKVGVDSVVEIRRPKIHHSVLDRIAIRGTGYAPIVLPEKYAVVTSNGAIRNLGGNTFETPNRAHLRAKAQQRVWDLVHWRRITYYSVLFVTLYLVLLPWTFASTREGCVDSVFCFVSDIVKQLGALLPSFVDGWIGTLSPTFISQWVMTASANPGVCAALAGIILMLMDAGKRLDGKIHDRMTAIWHPDGTLRTKYTWLHNFRESIAYQWTLRRFTKDLLPLFFSSASLISIALVSTVGISRIFFSLADSTGAFCTVDFRVQPPAITPAYSRRLEFDPSEDCWPSGLAVEKGATYRVVMNIADTMGSWKDGTLEADLLGNLENQNALAAILAWPSKRYLWENYFKPVARIRTYAEQRAAGQDEYVLNPTFFSSRRRYDCLVSDFTARSSVSCFFS